MNILEITEKLKKDYVQIVKRLDSAVDIAQSSLSIPKTVAPFQFAYHDLLKEYSRISDELDEMYHRKIFNVKIGNDELSVVDWNSSELKKMVETTDEYRKKSQILQAIKNDLKILEEMISTLKNFSFNVSNAVKFREMIGA